MVVDNYGYEVVSYLSDYVKDDEELRNILFYLYHTTKDEPLKTYIEDAFEQKHWCVHCGSELSRYEWNEIHNELEYDNVEHCVTWICNNCGE